MSHLSDHLAFARARDLLREVEHSRPTKACDARRSWSSAAFWQCARTRFR